MAARVEPPASDDVLPFWEATRRGELVLPWCRACRRPFWYPRAICPRCLGDSVEWRPALGKGIVYSVSVQHRPGPGREAADGPYAVALVDLDEGVRVMGNVLECAPDDVHVGMRVRAVWHPLSDGRRLLQFAPGA
jgi:uncharacterized OB-fold protein